jgi:hypothetical protein
VDFSKLESIAPVQEPQPLRPLRHKKLKFERKFILTCCSVFPESLATLFLLIGDWANSSGFSLSSENKQETLVSKIS